ncbi:MAG: hypothetical protein ACI4TM_06685 [Candidatus Cryptobacteroides sp.]
MIKGFEIETAELNEYELNTLMPLVAKGLAAHVGKENSVTNKHICDRLTRAGYQIDGARLRKIVNYIRIKGVVKCVIATSSGYYVATNKTDVSEYTESLRGRADAINAVADAVNHQASVMFID